MVLDIALIALTIKKIDFCDLNGENYLAKRFLLKILTGKVYGGVISNNAMNKL